MRERLINLSIGLSISLRPFVGRRHARMLSRGIYRAVMILGRPGIPINYCQTQHNTGIGRIA